MNLKKELAEKVPSKLKSEPHFSALLAIIRKQRIDEKLHLVKFLDQEIALVENWLSEHGHGGTATKAVRSKVNELDVLKKSLKIVREYLVGLNRG